MDESGLQVSERLLIIMHNQGAVNRMKAKKSDELAQILKVSVNDIDQILDRQVHDGYIINFTDDDGIMRHYLTGAGIIRVCSYFS